MAFQSFVIESPAPQITTIEQSLERKFGGFPLFAIGACARELTVINPRAKCSPAEMTIDSAVVLIFKQQQLVHKVSLNKFPCTTLCQFARAPWADGPSASNRSAGRPRGSGVESCGRGVSKPQPPTWRGAGEEEPRPTAWGRARRALAAQTTTPSPPASACSVDRPVPHRAKRAGGARHGIRKL